MKILVYGAGVIGCEPVHMLCKKNDVTLLSRGKWKETGAPKAAGAESLKYTIRRSRPELGSAAPDFFALLSCPMKEQQDVKTTMKLNMPIDSVKAV